jgi:hypothetical protein
MFALLAASTAEPSPQGALPPLAGTPGRPISNEAFPLSQEDLAARAEVIVHGTIESISIVRDVTNLFDERSFTAVLRVDRVERGEGIAPGDRLRVEYWRRQPLVASASESVGGYAPLPWKDTTVWLFARRETEGAGNLAPLLPNGWVPDEDRAADPEGLLGGEIVAVRDNRTVSLLPWSFVPLVASAVLGLAAIKAGPQSRGPMLLLAAGLAAAGLALAVW